MPVRYSFVKDRENYCSFEQQPSIDGYFFETKPFIEGCSKSMVGLDRLELSTSPLSGVRSSHLSYRPMELQIGGAGRDRTGDLLNANQALSQLSYSPIKLQPLSEKFSRGRLDARSGGKLTESRKQTRIHPSGEHRDKWNATASAYFMTTNLCYRSAPASTFSLRKEVIQPQVLLRLPCYDFTPIMNHTLGRCLPCGLARRLLVQSTFVM